MSTPTRRRLLAERRAELDAWRAAQDAEAAAAEEQRLANTDAVDAALAASGGDHLTLLDDGRCGCGADMGESPQVWARHRMEVAIEAARPLILAELNCRVCGFAVNVHLEGWVHCARCGDMYEHPEGLGQRAATARLDVCGPCEKAIDEELGKYRPEAVTE